MGIVFLIGNGFDLACGMKTRYTDMYDGYISSASPEEAIKQFKSDIERDIDTWGDFEIRFAKYVSRIDSEEKALMCMRDFKRYLRTYLVKEQENFMVGLNDVIVRTRVSEAMNNSLKNYGAGVSPNVTRIIRQTVGKGRLDINFITFNYTEVLDELLKFAIDPISNPYRLIHIHGKLSDNDMVLGVDNEEQIPTSRPLSKSGKRGLIKPVLLENYDAQRIEEAMNMLEQASIIVVFGMSLGESDLIWRNKLISVLNSNKDSILLLYDHDMSGKVYRSVDEKLDYQDECKECYFKQWGVADTADLFSRFHIPCGNILFNFSKVVQDALLESDKMRARIKENGL